MLLPLQEIEKYGGHRAAYRQTARVDAVGLLEATEQVHV